MLGWTIFLVDGSKEYARHIYIEEGCIIYTKNKLNKQKQTKQFKTIIPFCNILKIVEDDN